MTQGWSDQDKGKVKALLDRARKRAEDEALELYRTAPVAKIDDLWAMEQQIRVWRKERKGVFYFSYDRIESQIADYLNRGWLLESDLDGLSEARRLRIAAMR